MISDLTGLPVANASLLDEPTAVAEAMSFCSAAHRGKRSRLFMAKDCHPQTLEVTRTRAWPIDIEVVEFDPRDATVGEQLDDSVIGIVFQYPSTEGLVHAPRGLARRAHDVGALVVVAADLLSLALLEAPASWGADVVVGSTQRFGMPMGFGGPHAAYFATKEEYKRQVPGRIVGVSKDRDGKPALRLAIQTREQHIRRAKATSNICTAQVLPAVIASMYAVYHGPEGIERIANRIHRHASALKTALDDLGYKTLHQDFFDTLCVGLENKEAAASLLESARSHGMNLRNFGDGRVGVALDETTREAELQDLISVFARGKGREGHSLKAAGLLEAAANHLPASETRTSAFLSHEVFQRYRSETELLRYLNRLEAKDLSLTTSMIPLGSCTMKLNATSEMVPITWAEFAGLHPYVPEDQASGYDALRRELEDWLAEITGFAAISLQPNAGSQGEYAGLLAIRHYHESRGDSDRRVCLIPTSAHGTNPASAVMAGLSVGAVACDNNGNIDVADLRAKAEAHSDRLGALMVTYPSTHGVFESSIRKICSIVHQHGGQVYMDGANMNAQVGLCRPGDIGADVCHLNLHKTFCIPHGGGGPGMGPIGVMEHLVPFLPQAPAVGAPVGGSNQAPGPVSAAALGSGAILPISWAYIAMMGSRGLERASKIAILNANYMAARLEGHYPVLYRGEQGRVAHECILDLRPLKTAGIEVDDMAKRLMDFGFHAPTVSWPVAGTVMIEPTESESKEELDRFCDAMIAIREEVRGIESGAVALERSALRNAPHTAGKPGGGDLGSRLHAGARRVSGGAHTRAQILAAGEPRGQRLW